jgi:ABC-type transport system substrate-binding protein
MNTKAMARTTLALLIIVIILAASLIGAISYYGGRAPTGVTTTGVTATTAPAGAVPDFVKSATYVGETGDIFQWLDPAVSYYQEDYQILNDVHEKLLWYNGASSTEIIPWLAESYQKISPIKYVFKLRQGINFQDGTPFNARSVWFSLNRLLIIDGCSGVGNKGTQAAWIVQQMLDTSLSTYFSGDQPYDAPWVQKVLAQNFVEIVDPYTININIINPTTQFEYLLANEWADIVSPSFVMSHDFPSACKTSECKADEIDYTAYFNHIAGHGEVAMNYLDLPEKGSKAGTGPYYIDSVNPTTYEVVLKANPNYWGGPKNWKGPPISQAIKTVDFVYAPDLATRILDIKAGKASGIGVSPADIYSVADRDQWLSNGKLVSVIPGVTLYGPFPQFATDWFNFLTNVTDATGQLRKFQPFADIRFRLAVASSVNLTDAGINIGNRLDRVADNLIPPGTAPEGSYNPNIKPIYGFDLTKTEELLLDAQKNPITQFVDVNGNPYPPGTIDNSFSADKPHTVEFYVAAADTLNQKILSIMATNLNRISIKDKLGLTFTIVPIPGGAYYTLEAKHQIYLNWGGWINDYNHVLDWLGPMLQAGGTYPAWNNMNYTKLNDLYKQALDADKRGDTQALLKINDEMETLANQAVMYMYTFYALIYAVRTSYLQGYYWNPATAVYYHACYSYATS